MNFWEFFKAPPQPVEEERSKYAVLVVRVPREQISAIETMMYMETERNVSKDYIVGEALDEYLKKRIWSTVEKDNRIHIKRAETFGMKQAKN